MRCYHSNHPYFLYAVLIRKCSKRNAISNPLSTDALIDQLNMKDEKKDKLKDLPKIEMNHAYQT